jgi:WxL interacting protein linking bacterial and host surfaces
MKYKRKLVIIPLLVFAVFAVGIFFSIYAQKATPGLQVYPSNFDLTVTPGQTTTETVYLNNRTNQPVPVKAELRNFTALGEEGAVNLTTEDTSYSLAKWINVSPANATVAPQSTQKFTFTISPPFNAEPGGHYGSVVFATVPGSLNKTGATLSEEVASLILARVPGNTIENARVLSFDPQKNFYQFGPVTVDMRVKNLGQVHIQPSGQILIKGTLGDQYVVNLQPYNVLPGAIRDIPIVFSKHLLFGKYTVQLISTYGDTGKQLTGSTQFYAFPVEYGLIALVILVLLFLIRKRLGKALKAILTGK